MCFFVGQVCNDRRAAVEQLKFLQVVLGESLSIFMPAVSNVIIVVCSGSSLSIDHSWNISKWTQPQSILINLDCLLSA